MTGVMTPIDAWFAAIEHTTFGDAWQVMDDMGLRHARVTCQAFMIEGRIDGRWWEPHEGGEPLVVAASYDDAGRVIDVFGCHPESDEHHQLTGAGYWLGWKPVVSEVVACQSLWQWLTELRDAIFCTDWNAARPYLIGTPEIKLICQDRQQAGQIKEKLWVQHMPRLIVQREAA